MSNPQDLEYIPLCDRRVEFRSRWGTDAPCPFDRPIHFEPKQVKAYIDELGIWLLRPGSQPPVAVSSVPLGGRSGGRASWRATGPAWTRGGRAGQASGPGRDVTSAATVVAAGGDGSVAAPGSQVPQSEAVAKSATLSISPFAGAHVVLQQDAALRLVIAGELLTILEQTVDLLEETENMEDKESLWNILKKASAAASRAYSTVLPELGEAIAASKAASCTTSPREARPDAAAAALAVPSTEQPAVPGAATSSRSYSVQKETAPGNQHQALEAFGLRLVELREDFQKILAAFEGKASEKQVPGMGMPCL